MTATVVRTELSTEFVQYLTMAGEINQNIIKRTQDSLGKIIKRPTLTEKLLSRPPFRFLHDIITAYIKTTGLMKGLFTSEQLIADNVKEKDAKLAFLQKVVDYLTLVHGKPVPVRTMSIIAGKEPEKTNEMLVILADAVNKQVKNDEIIARLQSATVPESNMPTDPTRHQVGEKVEEKKSRREKEKHEDTQRQTTPSQKSAGHNKELNGTATHRKSSKEAESHRHGERRSTDKIRPEGDQNKEEKHHQRSKHHRRPESRNDPFPDVDKPIEGGRAPSNIDRSTPVNSTIAQHDSTGSTPQLRNSRPTSAKGSRQQKELDQQDSSESNVPRPSPMAVYDNEEAESAVNKNVGPAVTGLIIHENDNDSADESSDNQPLVLEETVGAGTEGTRLDDQPLKATEGEHGGLVTKILQSKKEFETGNLMPQQKQDGLSTGKSSEKEAARLREEAVIEKDVERLCHALQALSRSALPIGKLMDFVQEDLDSMQQEFEGWVAENNQLRAKLAEEERSTQKVTDPLKTKLAELQADAEGHKKAIGNCRARIMQNEERIQQIITRAHQVLQ